MFIYNFKFDTYDLILYYIKYTEVIHLYCFIFLVFNVFKFMFKSPAILNKSIIKLYLSQNKELFIFKVIKFDSWYYELTIINGN